MIGIAAAIVVYALLTPGERARWPGWCWRSLPALVVLPALSDVYAAANEGTLQDAPDASCRTPRAPSSAAARWR